MTPVPMIEPSSWLRSGVTVERTDGINLVRRTQFMSRILDFTQQSKLNVQLAYYPPYHSKYSPVVGSAFPQGKHIWVVGKALEW